MAATRWRAPPAGSLLVHRLDPLVAVFHRPSGTTHLLASPAPEILDMLAPAPLTAAELLHALAARFDLGEEGDPDALAERLEELAVAGLVEPL